MELGSDGSPSANDKPLSVENHASAVSTAVNGDEQKSVVEKTRTDDNSEERVTHKKENRRDPAENNKNADTRTKSGDVKRSAVTKSQGSLEEKRKSPPVQPEASEAWKKPAFSKQTSLEEKKG